MNSNLLRLKISITNNYMYITMKYSVNKTLKKWGGDQKRAEGFFLMEIIAGLTLIGCFLCVSAAWMAHMKKQHMYLKRRCALVSHIQEYVYALSHKTLDESGMRPDIKVSFKKYIPQVPELSTHPILGQALTGFELVCMDMHDIGFEQLCPKKRYKRYLGLLHENV